MSSRTRARFAAIGLAAAGLLLGVGGILHPRVDASAPFEEGLAGAFESPAWASSHALSVAGHVVLAVALLVLVRELGRTWTSRQRRLGWIAVAGAAIAVVESVPHLLAASEADALTRGASTPLTDLHTLLQAIATPVVGLSIAALALTGVRSRAFGSGRIAALAALVGGVAFAHAGPLIALTENPSLSPLFAGAAGLSIWFVATGVRLAWRLRGTGPPRFARQAPAA